MKIEEDKEYARLQFMLLYDALCNFKDYIAGGNLHILVEDNNTDEHSIEWLDNNLDKQKPFTDIIRWHTEKAILEIFKKFPNESDRDFILLGFDINNY